MKNIVIGTAGHIDHGKTTIIKYLTGKNTDTLPEEKKRGITIDLGFSFLEIYKDEKIGIVDVPGHEKFIKNMVAGISGINYIIFTIAVNDGIMPQTEEHFNIIKLLKIKHGVIVLTKTDLVSNEQIDKVKKQVKLLVKNSFLEKFKILETSIKNINSYKNLKDFIIEDIKNIEEQKENIYKENFKMYIDRCFSVNGFGTVVTGTILYGKVSLNDYLYLYPLNKKVRVKGIESHNEKKEKIQAGNRCALNITNIEKSQIRRGDIIFSSQNFVSSKIIDVMFEPLKNYSVKNNQRIKIYIGTKEINGKIRIFLENEIFIKKDEDLKKYPAELILDEEIAVEYGEIGIIRNSSSTNTLGGFKILLLSSKKGKRNDKNYIENLINIDKNIKTKENNNEKLKNIIKNFHENYPMQKGILRAELKNKYFDKLSYKEFKNLLEENILRNEIKYEKVFDKECISLRDYKIKFGKEEKILKEKIFKIYKENRFFPQKRSIIKEDFSNEKNFDIIHNYLFEEQMIIFLGNDFYILKGFFNEAQKKVTEFLLENKNITISQMKKLLEIDRISAIMILEKFDSLNITQRINDYRILK